MKCHEPGFRLLVWQNSTRWGLAQVRAMYTLDKPNILVGMGNSRQNNPSRCNYGPCRKKMGGIGGYWDLGLQKLEIGSSCNSDMK